MPKFISPRDVNFFKGIARELVDDVVQNLIVLYKVNLNDTRVNLYGESLSKSWHVGVELYSLINKSDNVASYDDFGSNTNQPVEFRLDRYACEEKSVYPEIGDVIYFDDVYYEIENTNEVQFVGGQPYNNFSIVCTANMVAKSSLNIEERVK